MGAKVSRTDFEWVYTEEPHASRRKIILEKYPEIKQLFGYDPNFKWVVTGMVLVQIVTLPLVQQLSWPWLVVVAYCFGGVINHSLMLGSRRKLSQLNIHHTLEKRPSGKITTEEFYKLATQIPLWNDFNQTYPGKENKLFSTLSAKQEDILAYAKGKTAHSRNNTFRTEILKLIGMISAIHEIAHNLAFGHARPMANRLFGFFANLPIGVPASVSFKKYHLEHHRYQGIETIDTDLPTLVEAKLFNTTFGKFIWLCLQPFFYMIRPLVVRPKPPEPLELVNLIIQLFFDACVVQLCGWKAMCYMIIGTLLAMGVHPVAGHFVSEHYMFKKGFETYSYYGALNFITFNVGYHMEHHDFPAVPGSRLPEVKRIAGEFYDDLPQHHSWTSVLYDFVMDPDIGPYARIKRKERGLES